MFMSDSDYIQLESRRAAQLAVQQWQTVTRLSKKELVRAHQIFVCKIYLIGCLCTVTVAVQWWFLTKIKSVQTFLIIYYYVILVIIFLNFLIMSLSQYVLREKPDCPRIIVVIYLILMVELGSVILSRPTIEADLRTFLFAMLFSIAMWSISFGLSAIGIVMTQSHRSPANLSLWSQKYYLITAISLLMTIQFRFVYAQISITLVMAFFLGIKEI